MSKRPLTDLLAGIIEVRRMCVFDPHMVPTVIDGVAYGANVDTVPDPQPHIGVEDFVFGYFALGLHHVPIVDGDFGTAICVNYGPLPSRWTDRAIKLHRAFGPRLEAVREHFRAIDLAVALADLPDAEPIRTFGTPRRAVIALALMHDLRCGAYYNTIRERALFAEPTATEAEIDEATALALSHLAAELREKRAEGQA